MRLKTMLGVMATGCGLLLMLPAQAQNGGGTAAAGQVLVPFVARDAAGGLVRDLTTADITILEDNKPQTVAHLELETAGAPLPAASPFAADIFAGHRLVLMYFDLTTMAPRDEEVAVASAEFYQDQVQQPGDLVAVAALGDSLRVLQDFTADKKLVRSAFAALGPALGDAATSADTADGGEVQITAVDRDLISLQSLCDMLAPLPARKAMLLYSGGLQRSGSNNEITLRSAVNAAVKGDVVVYALDTHLLPARAAGGSAGAASRPGIGAFNGQAQSAQLNSQMRKQDTLSTLASDTGGNALLSSNDDAGLYRGEQADGGTCYLASYRSTNPKHDGKYRKITVKVSRPGVRVTARPGYLASK